MVFQKPTPFPMSIYENIAFGIRLYERLPQSDSTSGLSGLCTMPPCGMRSRTSCTKAGAYPAVSNSAFASPVPSP